MSLLHPPPVYTTSTRRAWRSFNPDQFQTEPMFTTAPLGCKFRLFTPGTSTDVIKMVQALPDKQCSSDPLPTWLLKANAGLLAPFLCHLFN